MDINKIECLLTERLGAGNIIKNANMSEHTSFKAGGKARLLILPKDIEELRFVLYVLGRSGERLVCPSGSQCSGCRQSECTDVSACPHGEKAVPGGCKACESHTSVGACEGESRDCFCDSPIDYIVLGNGTNVLVRDGGYDGAIIKLGQGFDDIKIEGETLIAGAGALMSQIARKAAEAGLTGFEFASGIPGSIGGGVFMNAGAYGGELSNIIKYAKVISKDGMVERLLLADELDFSYRHSALMTSGEIVTEVALGLHAGDKAEILSQMKELARRRNEKQPVHLPSAGSFFKRPYGHFAGALIEEAGLKGLSVGGAQVSPLHAGFIVNTGGATAADIEALMHLVQNTVYSESSVMLEPEVRIIGKPV